MSSTHPTTAPSSTHPATAPSSTHPATATSSTHPATPTVTVRYFAGARAAAGVETETRDAGTLAELVGQIVETHGERLEKVLTACSFLVDGTQTRDRSLALRPGAVVDVLPPFAGG